MPFPESRYQIYQIMGSVVYHVLKKKKLKILDIVHYIGNGFLDILGKFTPI